MAQKEETTRRFGDLNTRPLPGTPETPKNNGGGCSCLVILGWGAGIVAAICLIALACS
jgi:hypothetical protein